MIHNLIYIIQRNIYERMYLKNYFDKFYKFHLSILTIKLNMILVLFCCSKL